MSFFPNARGIPKRFIAGPPFNQGDSKTHQLVVPDGKIWQIIWFGMKPSDSATVNVYTKDPEGNYSSQQLSVAAGTAVRSGPAQETDQAAVCILWEKEILELVFGATQTTGRVYAYVIEFDIEELLKK